MKLRNDGFTLVELLAVIAILSILLIIVMPNALNLFARGKKEAFVTQVQSIMSSAIEHSNYSILDSNYTKPPYCNNCGLANNLINPSANALDYYVEIDQNTREITQIAVSSGNYCFTTKSPSSNKVYILNELEEGKKISCSESTLVDCSCVNANVSS